MKFVRHRPATPWIAALALASVPVGLLGCTQEPITVSVRSLEQSGRTAFLCLAAPGTTPSAGLPLTSCAKGVAGSLNDFQLDEAGKTKLPHLYALVTQTTRGEVAVIDLTLSTGTTSTTTSNPGAVLDQDPTVPGANFLPVGAQPVDIVATPNGTAAFVTVAEVGREGIYALPSTKLRPCVGCTPPTLSSFPACSLPAVPGTMVMVADPAVDGAVRASCDGAYGDTDPAGANGDIGLEAQGRQKLVVAMPDLGGIAVIDAQTLLDGEPGSFAPCAVERWMPLATQVPPPPQAPDVPAGPACVQPKPQPTEVQTQAPSRPAGLAHDGSRLYVADLGSPLIHVVDMPTPCEPVERPPLVATSVEEPTRVVTTSRVAVSRELSADLRRFLYAIDAGDGSTMVFDVTDGDTSLYPLRRPHPEWNPFQSVDRLRFGAPVRDVILVDRDTPLPHPATGVVEEGVRCDPDPALTSCASQPLTCDPATLYRTEVGDYKTGAGPLKLRGSFAYAVLTTGEISVIDVDDLDAKCRVPSVFSDIYGCPPPSFDEPVDATKTWLGSQESSCNVVVPHTPRSATFVVSNDAVGRHEPGLQSYPLLHDKAGTIVPATEAAAPQMRATLPNDATKILVSVAGSTDLIDDTGAVQSPEGPKNTLVMNLEDPRVHVFDQPWAVTYEGGLPGFDGKVAELRLATGPSGEDELHDPQSRFCDQGVQSEESVRALLEAQGLSYADAVASAPLLADHVQITTELPAEDNAHWGGVEGTCSFQQCKATFGAATAPRPERELRIREAYQDHVIVGEGAVSGELTKCCFPTLVAFNVRARGQWVVIGGVNGFMHHVIPDPASGVCRNSCDPELQRMNGRVRTAPSGAVLHDGDPLAFMNPMFRLAITQGSTPPLRDFQFRFTTQGSFVPLVLDLTAATSPDLQPQAITFLSTTGELVVTDGLFEGVFFVSAMNLDVTRQYF